MGGRLPAAPPIFRKMAAGSPPPPLPLPQLLPRPPLSLRPSLLLLLPPPPPLPRPSLPPLLPSLLLPLLLRLRPSLLLDRRLRPSRCLSLVQLGGAERSSLFASHPVMRGLCKSSALPGGAASKSSSRWGHSPVPPPFSQRRGAWTHAPPVFSPAPPAGGPSCQRPLAARSCRCLSVVGAEFARKAHAPCLPVIGWVRGQVTRPAAPRD